MTVAVLSSASRPRILLIEDDKDLAVVIKLNLEANGYEVAIAEIDMQGLTMALAEKYNLLLRDIKLPDLDGNTICKRLWAESLVLPVLMLTSR